VKNRIISITALILFILLCMYNVSANHWSQPISGEVNSVIPEVLLIYPEAYEGTTVKFSGEVTSVTVDHGTTLLSIGGLQVFYPSPINLSSGDTVTVLGKSYRMEKGYVLAEWIHVHTYRETEFILSTFGLIALIYLTFGGRVSRLKFRFANLRGNVNCQTG